MKRRSFRLASVLKVYELRKQQAEMALAQATRRLCEIDGEIEALGNEIAALATTLQGPASRHLSTTAWIAVYAKTQHLDQACQHARVRRQCQSLMVTQLQDERKKWSIAEESLRSLRHSIETENHVAADKAQQLQLDETVLRGWSGPETA